MAHVSTHKRTIQAIANEDCREKRGEVMTWKHISDTTQRARRRYGCALCGTPIEIGETYIRRFGYADGEASVTQMHPECEAETRDWDAMDWETCSGDMERPVVVTER
jgi:hypothetical protein